MKRILILFALLAMGTVLVAEEAVLIDFSTLKADKEIQVGTTTDASGNSVPKTVSQNEKTIMDFSRATNKGSSTAGAAQGVMISSLAIENWEVVLASSSRTVENQRYSYTKPAVVNDTSKKYPKMTVLGVRIHFPIETFNSWALIKPPFEIPAFENDIVVDDKGAVTEKDAKYYESHKDEKKSQYTRFEGGLQSYTDNLGKEQKILVAYGVVKNVGVIKAIAVNVLGMNFPHGLSVVLKDENSNEQVIFLGYLNFDGWREIRWENPAYVEEVRNRELRIFPLYPKSTPYVKFQGFIIHRDAAHEGGDFVGYFKDVKIIYDKAVSDDAREINDEDVWGIVTKKETDRKKIEFARFGDQQVLRYLEDLKKANEDFDAENYDNQATGAAK
jgi:hypothetical protein